ncbi:MAG: MMPL family transporter [Gammaproteobacteria bacterium]|jgi:predicted RND superfamily exporter protein|nr:MMPL family transporter [Gammaproteobacteria bacterium]
MTTEHTRTAPATHASAPEAIATRKWYQFILRHPKLVLIVLAAITVVLAMQLKDLRWETDARVYLPKGHPAIIYDEKVADLFGVKDSLVIGIVNDGEQGVYNTETLERIQRITDQVAAIPGVIAIRSIDVASLSSATIFVGDEESIGSVRLMPEIPQNASDIDRLRGLVEDNADLFVGNLVSADGKATMIRAKLKEGADNRYQAYFWIKGIIDAETGGGDGESWSGAGSEWSRESGSDSQPSEWTAEEQAEWWSQRNQAGAQVGTDNGDRFYLAGRPVIEVTSGLHAMSDMAIMIPFLAVALAISLFLIFRTARGVLLPLITMAAAIVWTMGLMALANVPLYTISTMLPVILVAVSIGDTVHFMSHYYDHVLHDAHRPSSTIVGEVLGRLGAPLITTSVTTAVGFLSLVLADMPPFVHFGLFTVLGILLSWLLTITLIPAMLCLMQPKVGNYLVKRRQMRVHSEQNHLTRLLVSTAGTLHRRSGTVALILLALAAVAAVGASRLFVDSSWLSDFREDSELVQANDMFNDKFDGTIFLNMVVEGKEDGAFRNPELLKRLEAIQAYGETLPYVGSARSIVDYIKNVNKTLHAGDPAYDVIPDTEGQIGEFLFLLSVSGRPELLDEVIDYNYRQGLVTFAIKTDHTRDLRQVIEQIREQSATQLAGMDVDFNFAGSANNSYIWAQLLIGSQTMAILVSKIGIFLLAALLFRSLATGLYTIVPVSLTTLFIAGFAGWSGIPLDVSTALAAGVAIGVGVDYAVHYIFRYRDEAARLGSGLAATQETMRTVGKTIAFSALVVTIGFGVLCFSQFPPHAKLGWFVAAYMVVSCLVALITLPLLFRLHERLRGRPQDA